MRLGAGIFFFYLTVIDCSYIGRDSLGLFLGILVGRIACKLPFGDQELPYVVHIEYPTPELSFYGIIQESLLHTGKVAIILYTRN